MDSSSLPTVDELCSRTSWIQGLARRLVSDPDQALDLAQRAELAALRHGGSPPRSWFARVLRNLMREEHRREVERPLREQRAAREGELPAVEAMAARVEVQREVARAVLGLEEPYRSVILWRYFEGLPPREIARRSGLALATISSRLTRAHAALREALERARPRTEDGTWWLSALLPLARREGLEPAWIASGALIVKAHLPLVLSLAALSLALVWWIDPEAPESPGFATTNDEVGKVELPLEERRTPSEPTPVERDLVARSPTALPTSESFQRAPRSVNGRVYEAEGRPLADVRVVAGNVEVTSDAGGGFELELDSSDATQAEVLVFLSEPGFETVVAGRSPMLLASDLASDPAHGELGRHTSGASALVIGAPALELSGHTVDAAGAPIAGAEVSILLPVDFAARFAESFDRSQPVHRAWRTRSDDAGRFALRAGFVSGAALVARRENYLPASVELPASWTEDLVLVLELPALDADVVRGQVVDPWGRGAGDALVGMGLSATISDADGRFVLSRKESRGASEVHAVKRGFGPASGLAPPVTIRGAPAHPPFLYLQLGPEPLSLSGTVVDGAGQPLAGARVWAADATPFPGIASFPGFLEAYLGGGLTGTELRAESVVDGRAVHSEVDEHAERPTALWGWVETDADGRFALGGLSDREYVLRVLRMEGLHSMDAGPFHAGTSGVRVVFEPSTYPRVAGRVVGRDGRALSGVRVHANCVPIELVLDHPDGTRTTNSEPTHGGPFAMTDENGRFGFEGLGRERLFLTLSADTIVVRHVGLTEGGLARAVDRPVDDLVLVVLERSTIAVELFDATLADQFAVVDSEGEALPLYSFEGGGMSVLDRGSLIGGRSRVFSMGSDARQVLLYRDGDVVLRLAIHALPGELCLVRY